MQKILILASAILGLGCLAVFFARQNTAPDASPSSQTPAFQCLQIDTAALGAAAPCGDGGFAAGNSRGELRIFASSESGVKPTVIPLSKYPVSAPVLDADGILYVGDENGRFFACSPERGILWSFPTGNQIIGGAVSFGGLIWFGSHDQNLYALDPKTGEVRHTVECGGQINGTPVILESGSLIIGSCDGKLRKIDIKTGAVIAELEFSTPIPGSPILFDGTLYILGHSGILAAVNPETFQVLYQKQTGTKYLTAPFAANRFLFATDMDGKIEVFLRRDGTRLAALDSADAMTRLSAGNDDTVYAVSRHGLLKQWKRTDDSHWEASVLADFQADFSEGVVQIKNGILAADDSGMLFYLRGDTP